MKFENTAYNNLPIDKSLDNKPRQVSGAIYSECKPTKRSNPRIICLSKSALELLDLDEKVIQDENNHLILGGNLIPKNSIPMANCYCGY